MIKGGIAGKLGNRYEAKWLVYQLLDVIGNKAEWLRFEGITPDFRGFEFAVKRNGITEWHQVKINSPKGNWTINALKREGVIDSFKKRFESSANDVCIFISQDPAKDLRLLSEKAEIANDEKELKQELSYEQNSKFNQLSDTWEVDEATTFRWLKRCRVRTIPESEIDTSISSRSDLYFINDIRSVFPILRDYLENRFNRILTTKTVISEINALKDIKIKDWSLDPTVSESILEANKNYLESYSPFGFGGIIIPRQQTNEIVDLIKSPQGPTLILLTGIAGSGKSGVVRAIIKELEFLNILHLAFRADHYLTKNTPKEIGYSITERYKSPVTTLKGLQPDGLTVLIVDQIDAVSEVSGRSGILKDAILQMVEQANIFTKVRLLLICRTFDFKSDSRLKLLKEKENAKIIELPILDWKNDVEPILVSKDIAPKMFSHKQKRLLSLPLNLAIFLEIAEEKNSFLSRNDLFNSLLEKKERTVRSKYEVNWSIKKPLLDISQWMSDKQILSAPESILDTYPGAVDILSSEGLIVQSKNTINFFHESFFDYIYARSFIGGRQTLVELLNSTEQHLFRRTQTRQILETLRQYDFNRYLRSLKEVLSNNSIRYHIKVAVAQWLGSLNDPDKDELIIIQELDDEQESFVPLVRYALLSTENWFNILNKEDWILNILNSKNEDRRRIVLLWLSSIAGEYPDEISKLLETWWNNNRERGNILLDWFGMVRRQKPDASLIRLCEKVIRSNPTNLFKKSGKPNIEFLISNWVEERSDRGAGILKALFDVWFELHPDQHPFEDYKIRDFEEHSLKHIAEKSPIAFIEGSIDLLVRTINVINDGKTEGKEDYTFTYRTYSEYSSGSQGFLSLFISSIQEVAKNNPEKARTFLFKLDESKHVVILHIHLEAVSSNGEIFAKHLINLLKNKNIFEAGWSDHEWRPFANAAKAAFPYLSTNQRIIVEEKIYNHQPELDLAIKMTQELKTKGENEIWWNQKDIIRKLNRSGYRQFCILETIGNELLTDKGTRLLKILRRKFPKHIIPGPNRIQGGVVHSPIPLKNTKLMSDNDWINAMAHYDGNEKKKINRDLLSGDATELAREIENVTKDDPERIINLMKRIPDDAHQSYLTHILRGLSEAEEVNHEQLLFAILNAHDRPGKPYGKDIAWLIEKQPKILTNQDAFDILVWYLNNGNASDDKSIEYENIKREIVSIKDLIERGGSYYIRGINGQRGAAAEAIGRALWKVPELADRVWNILDNRIEIEPLISVRCCLMTPLVPLFNIDRKHCAMLIEKLIEKPKEDVNEWKEEMPYAHLFPLITHQGMHLLPYILRNIPEVGRRLVEHLVKSGDETMHLIGAWLIFRQSYDDENYRNKADNLIEKGVTYRRLAADVSSYMIINGEFRNRAEQQLIRFFDDEDEEVRRQAAGVFYNIESDDFHRYTNLAKKFIDSQALKDDASGLLRTLDESVNDIYELVIMAAEKIISIFCEEKPDLGRRDLDLYKLKDLLKREYIASERIPILRKRVLDVIDKMLENELYGVHEILIEHERD